ncbi:MAG: hypothetical protein NXI17_07325 [Alphaproteobacteria bacterium]|nr:hypothetical protein [Alphaproteobacteria bacterium]
MNAEATKLGRSHVLMFSQDPQASRMMETVFSSLTSYQLTSCSLEELGNSEEIDPEAFDIAILDVGDGSVLDDPEFLRSRQSLGKLSVLFISDELNQQHIRQLMKLDGADWLSKPLVQRALTDTVSSITQRQKSNGNKVHAVVSCGGGSGGSSVAIMMAHYMSRKRKRSHPTAALFDLDFSKADIGAYLNIENSYRLENVIGKSERVDLEFIDVIKKVHDSGFSLFSFESPKLTYSEMGPELVLKMLDLVSYRHDHTVLDLSSYMTRWQSTILSAVDTVTIVSGPSLPSLQRAKHRFKEISTLRNSEAGIRVVTNRIKTGFFGSQFGKKELGKLFDPSILTILPDEQHIMLEAVNRGILPSEVNQRSNFCSNVQNMSDAILEEVT